MSYAGSSGRAGEVAVRHDPVDRGAGGEADRLERDQREHDPEPQRAADGLRDRRKVGLTTVRTPGSPDA